MEEVFDLGVEATDSESVQQILEAEALSYFKDLGDDELYSPKHCRQKKQTDAQRDALEDTIEGIWISLESLNSATDLKTLDLPYFDTKQKQDALKSAMKKGSVNRKFLTNFIRQKWPTYLDEKKRPMQRTTAISQSDQMDARRMILPSTSSAETTTEDLHSHIVTFPSLADLIADLINKVDDPTFEVHKYKDLHKEIQSFGSRQFLKARMMKCIPLEVRGLEGKAITREILDEIFEAQGPLPEWPANGGYLLYITSTKEDKYWRPYVGQSALLIRRILQHTAEVLHGNLHTLCYWVASKPDRQLNFIRLWEATEENGDCQLTIESLNSFLEMLFCLSFQSLPLPTLKEFLGDQTFSLRGLNVVSPLLQSLALTGMEKAKFRSWLDHSPSFEIKEFVRHRHEYLEKERKSSFQLYSSSPNYKDIKGAFVKAITQNRSAPFIDDEAVDRPSSQLPQIANLTTLRSNVASYLKQRDISEHLWGLPYGTTEARIGFVLDYDILSAKSDSETTLPAHFPPSLASLGFHENNCLLWPFNFQLPYVPRMLSLAGLEDTTLREINRQIIDASSLQVIIICGTNAEKMTSLSSASFEKIKLEIRNVSYEAFLETEQSMVRRVYLRLPTYLSALHSSNLRMSSKIALAIKTAACLTHTQSIVPYYFRSRVALSEVVAARLREEEGKYEMTIDTITENIWSWLWVRGFDASDVSRLAKIGGSVSRGLLLAMVTAPWQRKETRPKTSEPRAFPKPDRSLFCHRFTESQLQEAKIFHEQRQHKRKSSELAGISQEPLQPDDNLLETEEVSEDLQTVTLDDLAFESSTDPATDREIFETVANCLERETSELSFKASKGSEGRKKPDLAPRERKGKDMTCCWCEKPTFSERSYPCWSSVLEGSLCKQCSMTLLNGKYLPICKFRILDLDIQCGFCGLSVGPDWKFITSQHLPTCSSQCRYSIRFHIVGEDREATRRGRKANIHQSWVKWQDQMPEKLQMSQ